MALRRLAVLLALALATAGSRLLLAQDAEGLGKIRDPSFLPRGNLLRTASFGERLILSDAYWLRFVQYVGETVILKQQRWEAMYPLADLVTDLDPRFGYAYQVAGSNLSGLAQRYDEADQILLKGMRHVPDRWSLPLVMGINKFLYQQDYTAAAEYIRRAAQVGKRPHLALLAANLSALADSDAEYQTALAFLDQALEHAGTDELKAELRDRRSRTATFWVLSRLEKALGAYRRMKGHPPARLEELVTAGLLPEIPPDPSGGALQYDPSDGTVKSSVWGARAPLRVTR
ncbi:MAG TPA: hypothetical protein VFG59_04740 [Anaeromyxobacter sp.]|nr:hypothetical protein [Anaeromyxobacter sp.]